MKWSSRQYLIALNMVPGIGGRRLQALVEHFGSLARAWTANEQELLQVSGFGQKTVELFLVNRQQICPFAEEEWARSFQGQIVTLADKNYPHCLRRLVVPPPVLYVKGQLPQDLGIAVVGTRRPSRVGIAQTREFTSYLVDNKEIIISGLARGIDYFAHETTLQKGGITLGVLGSNIGKIYPSEHQSLVEQIAKEGAIVSEFSSRCPTVPGNFPRRNRLIAGFSKGVLVIQAGEKSGALGTSDWALELGLDVWALPGEISDPLHVGTNNLIKQGAYLVTSPQDLGGTNSLQPSLDFVAVDLFRQGFTVNEISQKLHLPVEEVMAEITLAQVLGTKGKLA